MKPGDRYLKIVEWSEEDGCYVGSCPGLMQGGIHGENEASVYAELCQTVEEWIAIHEQDGIPLPPATAGKDYSGKFVVRVGKELHRELAVHAWREGVSLNSYCAKVLREGRAPYGSALPAQEQKQPRPARQNSPYPNLPPHQQAVQRLADEFNAAEREWERKHPVKPRRKSRSEAGKGAKAIGFKIT